MEWLTSPAPEYEVPNTDWIIIVFPRNRKDDGKPDPSINSWLQPVIALKDFLRKICNLKGELVFCPYHWPNGLK